MSIQIIFARKSFSAVMAFLQIVVPLWLLFVNIFSVFLQVGWICGFIWADITFSGCFWLCHSIGVLSHVIVVSWLSNWSLSTLLTCERSFVMSSNLVYCKVDFLFKTFATLVAEEVDHPFPIFALYWSKYDEISSFPLNLNTNLI